MFRTRSFFAALAVAVAGLLALPVLSLGDLDNDLSSNRSEAAQLRTSIAAETKRINATATGVRQAEARLARL